MEQNKPMKVMPKPTTYLEQLATVAKEDVEGLLNAEREYGGSWKKRGGIGAFMMLARKWDRLEKQLTMPRVFLVPTGKSDKDGNEVKEQMLVQAYDIFSMARRDPRPEGIIDDVRDLRRYLLLVEAELRAMGVNPAHRDNPKPAEQEEVEAEPAAS